MPSSSIEEALYTAPQSFDSEAQPALQLRASYRGKLHQLCIQGNGACTISQLGDAPASSCTALKPSLFHGSSLPHQIPAADVVGATSSGSELVIWHSPLHKPGADKPTRHLHRTPALQLESPSLAEQAAQHLRSAACWWHGGQHPPRLLVIVNPASGPGKAPSIYEQQVRPALEAAGCRLEMHLTQARAHATELVLQVPPGSVDAIVAIGGDGTMHEVLQGMLGRPDWAEMARTPFAQIPCGSGNALAASTGLWSVHTALHALVKGARRPLDISSVLQHSPPRRCFCFLSLNFGLITNLDIGTEHLRWMGGTRFVVGALQQILLKKKHAARVALLAAPEGSSAEPAAAAAAAAGAADGSANGSSAAADALLQPGSRGSHGGDGQQQPSAGLQQAAATPGPPVQQLAAFQSLAGRQLPAGWEWLPDPEVALFTATNLPRLDMNFHLAPDATPDSGHFNLIYTPPASRRAGLELMTASERGAHMHLVKQRRLAALALEPLSTGTWLVVDGEAVPYSPIFLEVHASLCSVITAPPHGG